MTSMRPLYLTLVLVLAQPASACTVFCVSDGTRVFAGNNEDWMDPATRMWFVPAEGKKRGRIYFGFANGFPQGGMNDAGLFFDGLALGREEVPSSELPSFDGNLTDRAMAECETVKEVLALFGKYERGFLAQAQLLFADRNGDAAVIEGNAVVRKEGRFLASTNFRASKTSGGSAACDRHRIASRLLAADGEATLDLCRRVLAATHQEGPGSTLYSNVYDLKKGLVYIYHFHDFENVVVIDLGAELRKGAHGVELSSLFPETHAFTDFRRRAEQKVAEERKQAAQVVDPKTFSAFVGRYRFKDGPAAGTEVAVRLDDDKLVADLPTGGHVELTPRGGASFAVISTSFRAELKFSRVDGGDVTGMKVDLGGLEVTGERLR
jgi:hypothetical protein